MAKYLLALLLLAVHQSALSLPLPPYIKPCKANEQLDECAIEHGNEAWPTIIKGDKKYRVPVLNPLEVKEMQIRSGSSQSVQLNLTLTDSKMHGLKDMKLVNSRIDLKNKHVEWDVEIPTFTILGDYEVSGKFLVLPIKGKGPSNVTISDMKATVSFDFTLDKKKGQDYMKIGKASIKYTTSRLYAKLENLFNGEKLLSDNMNQVIDDNWEEFNKELGPSVAQGLAEIFKSILSNIVTLVPFNNVFV